MTEHGSIRELPNLTKPYVSFQRQLHLLKIILTPPPSPEDVEINANNVLLPRVRSKHRSFLRSIRETFVNRLREVEYSDEMENMLSRRNFR